MRIMTLNTWGGRAGKEAQLDFFRRYQDEVDIFCLQEVWADRYKDYEGHKAGGVVIDHDTVMTDGLQRISAALSSHVPFFRPHFLDNYGLLMLVRAELPVLAEGELFVYKEKGHMPEGDIGTHARNIQYVTIEDNGTPLTVINFHGLWNGKGKTDTDDRLQQSKNILGFIDSLNGECVLCGDFNLLPETKSLRMFKEHGMKDLVLKYGVTSTRSSFYQKPEKFADYVFLSPGLAEKDFAVLDDEVSDHLPLLLTL